MILDKVKSTLLALLAALSGILLGVVGWNRGQRLKRTAEKLKRELARADAERENRLYVKKIKIPIIVSDTNRMFNDNSGENDTDNDT